MFEDPPGCWLDLAGGTERLSWRAAGSGRLAAFPFPAPDPAYAGALRGRAYMIVVFRDRPEVRAFVDSLLGDDPTGARAAAMIAAGVWPVMPANRAGPLDDVSRGEEALLRRALDDGSFRVSAMDLLPGTVATAFSQQLLAYLGSERPELLGQALSNIDAAWPRPSP